MMTFYSCMGLLPQVLDLVLKYEECFHDDTTAEKLLGWLRESSKTKEYYSSLMAECSPVVQFISDCLASDPVPSRTVFTLKLLGVLCEGALTHTFDIAGAFTHRSSYASPVKRSRQEMDIGGLSERDVGPNHLLHLHLIFARKDCLWENASVRCAWFDACTKALPIMSLNFILQDVGAIEVGWTCLDDSSMFVQSAAEACLAATILQQFQTNNGKSQTPQDQTTPLEQVETPHQQTPQEKVLTPHENFPAPLEMFSVPQEQFVTPQELCTTQQDNLTTKQLSSDGSSPDQHNAHKKQPPMDGTSPMDSSNDCSNAVSHEQFSSEIFQKLLTIITTSDLSLETSCTDKPFSVINTNSNILTNPPVTRTSAIKIFRKVLNLAPELGLLAAKHNHVATSLCTFLTNSKTNNVLIDVVDLLTEMMLLTPVSERASICGILQDAPMMLLFRRHEALAAASLASALWRFESRSIEKDKHMEFVMSPLGVMVEGDGTKGTVDGDGTNGRVDGDCRRVFADICRQSKSACRQLITSSLNSLLAYTQQTDLTDREMGMFGNVLINLLKCIHSETEPDPVRCSLIGATKLGKKCYDILAIICKSKSFGIGCLWAVELLTVAVGVVRNPETDITMLAKVLEVVSKLDFLYSQVDGDANDLAFVIQKLLMSNSSWERRDSGIGFIDNLVRNSNDGSARWVCKHNFPRFLWERLSDPQSYVRASACLSLSGLLLNEKIMKPFLDDVNVSTEEVLMELCRIVTTDDGGFARRAAMTSLTEILSHEGAVRTMLLKYNLQSCKRFNTSCQARQKQRTISIAEFQNTDVQNDIFDITNDDNVDNDDNDDNVDNVDERGESADVHCTFATTRSMDVQLGDCTSSNMNLWNFVIMAVNTALNDLDWEVKLKAVEYWDTLVNIVLEGFLPPEDRSLNTFTKKDISMESDEYYPNESRKCNVDYVDTNDHGSTCLLSSLSYLCNMGLPTLMNSVNDYDRLVGLSCCQLLIKIRSTLQSSGIALSELNSNLRSHPAAIDCSHCRSLQVELGLDFDDPTHFKLDENVLERVVDFVRTDLRATLADKSLLVNDYSHNPLLLLEDIIATATVPDDTEQLIDCY